MRMDVLLKVILGRNMCMVDHSEMREYSNVIKYIVGERNTDGNKMLEKIDKMIRYSQVDMHTWLYGHQILEISRVSSS